MNAPTRFAQIGFDEKGREHRTPAMLVSADDLGLEFVGGADIDDIDAARRYVESFARPETLQRFQSVGYNISPESARRFSEMPIFSTPEELMRRTSPQLTMGMVPHDAHGPIARLAAAHGSHYLGEKPLASGPADSREIAALFEASELTLGIGYEMPYLLPELMRDAQAGQLIRPILGGSFDWGRTTGGSWRDLGGQCWAAVGPALASPPVWVCGRASNYADRARFGPPLMAEDMFDAEVICEHGETVTMHTSWAVDAPPTVGLVLPSREAAWLRLWNETSTVDAPVPVPKSAHYEPQLEAFRALIRRDGAPYPRGRGALPQRYTDAIIHQNREWVLAAQGQTNLMLTVPHALAAELVVDAAARSAADNESGGWGPWLELAP